MDTRIDRVFSGVTNCYLVRQRGAMLVDAGQARHGKLTPALKRLEVDPKSIQLLMLTHAHWDHTGSTAEIKRLTSCKVAIHEKESEVVETGKLLMVPGCTAWGRAFSFMLKVSVPIVGRFEATSVDLKLGSEDRSLQDFGIDGTVIYTPGHSSGSTTVLLESGDAFVGDLAMGGFPRFGGPGMPIIAEDIEQNRESWRMLLKRGAKRIFPGHGPPFDAALIRREL